MIVERQCERSGKESPCLCHFRIYEGPGPLKTAVLYPWGMVQDMPIRAWHIRRKPDYGLEVSWAGGPVASHIYEPHHNRASLKMIFPCICVRRVVPLSNTIPQYMAGQRGGSPWAGGPVACGQCAHGAIGHVPTRGIIWIPRCLMFVHVDVWYFNHKRRFRFVLWEWLGSNHLRRFINTCQNIYRYWLEMC